MYVSHESLLTPTLATMLHFTVDIVRGRERLKLRYVTTLHRCNVVADLIAV